ncbi:ABC transporter ATP-binding protein [Nocardioides sp. JQ2195]|uniref:ABC transporter ATP-binding protein n=1 Tax=Nocardioides sp. JQ2195 TaxID=2592334 RepID=UPI00143EA021|nr:ABC transporter ATP-binding protein [Nocardioides sp. JQ2195]QIX27967.1 ABC transporter ATP-binding protein [Nocardioides sp. JQ2195]
MVPPSPARPTVAPPERVHAPPGTPGTSTPPASAWALLRRGLARNKARLVASFGLLSLWQACETLVPVMIGLIIDRAVATGEVREMVVWGLALCALFGFLSYGYRFGAQIGFSVMQQEMHRTRVEIAAHALHPRGARTSLRPGETLSLATADAELVGQFIRSMGFTVAAVISLAGASWYLLTLDLTLGLVVLVGVPMVLALTQAITPAISRHTEHQQSTVAEATGVATDLIRGLRVLKGIGAESVAGSRYRALSGRARDASVRSTSTYGAMAGLTQGLSGLFLAAVAVVAGHRALSGDISIGELIAVVGLTQFLAEPLGMLGDISAHTARAHASARRIVVFLHTPHLVPVGDAHPHSGAGLRLTSVTAPGLNRVSLDSRPGEILGIAVTDPAAAASLMALVSGSSSPVSGDLTLGGLPLDELSLAARNEHLLVSPHHVDLFEGTLRSNIDPTSTLAPAELDRLLDASACADVVSLVPEGLDQPVTPDGATFSGGQRQRIALARALATDAPLLVLHDPTTAVDAVTEHRIAAGIRELRSDAAGRRTTWLVTSSPALLAQCDRVLLITDAGVTGEGTHHELAADPTYAEVVLR